MSLLAIQALQRSLSDRLLNSLIKIGDTLDACFDPIDGLFVGKKRLFYQGENCPKCLTSLIAWIVGEVMTVPIDHLVTGCDESLDLLMPQTQTDRADRLLILQRSGD